MFVVWWVIHLQVAGIQIQSLWPVAKIVILVRYSPRKGPNHYKEKCKYKFIRKCNIASDKQHLELSKYVKCVPLLLCSGRNILQLYLCITFKQFRCILDSGKEKVIIYIQFVYFAFSILYKIYKWIHSTMNALTEEYQFIYKYHVWINAASFVDNFGKTNHLHKCNL